MKDILLEIAAAIVAFSGAIYLFVTLLCSLVPRRWFDAPSTCGNVGEEE